jgi:predicted amidophosphoribosyltransferase
MAAAAYAGPLREALVAFKDHGRWTLRAPLGDLLARAVAGSVHDGCAARVVLVPVPSSRSAARERDGDHVRELARRAAIPLRRAGLEVRVVGALWPPRHRHDQVGLGRAARAANLAGTLLPTARAAALGECGASVLLVDDLVTTGATLAEAARALGTVGVVPLGAAVVAATGMPGAGPLVARVATPDPPGG